MESLLTKDLVKEISKLLGEMKLNEALSAINDNKYSMCLKDNSWDLIPPIISHLNEKNNVENTDLYYCCEKLLLVIAEKSNPEEALLEFIEQAELAKSDVQFLSILKALEKILVKLTNKRGRSLDWTLNTIQDRLSKLQTPGDFNLECEEKTLLDADSAVSRITFLYSEVLPFYKHFIDEVSLSTHNSKESKKRRISLTSSILQLLGKPLAHLDLECDARTKSRARLCAEKIMSYLSCLVSNPFIFLQYVTERNERTNKVNNDLDDEPVQDIFACEVRTPTLSLGVYYYLLLSENLQYQQIPVVYSTLYIFRSVLYLAAKLLETHEQYFTRKGILLAHAIICNEGLTVIPFQELDSDVHRKFCKNVSGVMIYSDIKQYRELCLKLFKTYLFKFDTKGKYYVIYNLMHMVKHVNMKGFLVTQYKDMLRDIMSTDENKISEFFSGNKLFKMLDLFSELPDGSFSDLMELGDQIISTLNLLTYLVIRDKYNTTGIWNYLSMLEQRFLKPLKEGLMMSKDHYQNKIKELNKENGQGDRQTSIKVGFHNIPTVGHEDKLATLEFSLNSFAALEMLLARVEELIAEGPKINI